MKRSLRRARHGIGDIVGPDRPDQASQFIGDRNRRFVVAAPVAEGHRPSDAKRLSGCALDRWRWAETSTARAPWVSQAAEVAVPVFGDPTETPAMPTGVLAWGEPQPTGKLASPSEGADMPHGPDQGRRGQEPNAGDLAQAPYDRVGVGQGPQVALECRDAGFDGADLVAHARQHVPQVQRQQQLGIFQDRGNGLHGGARPGGQQQPVLAQDPTQGVDAGGPVSSSTAPARDAGRRALAARPA